MPASRQGTSGRRVSVLLIEDEMLISLDLCETLVAAGYDVLGPAHTVQSARLLIEHHEPEIAIVDVLLRDGPCSGLAHQLRRRDIPFVVYSGYGRHAAEIDGFADARWLAKPASPGEVLQVLKSLSPQVTETPRTQCLSAAGARSPRGEPEAAPLYGRA